MKVPRKYAFIWWFQVTLGIAGAVVNLAYGQWGYTVAFAIVLVWQIFTGLGLIHRYRHMEPPK